MRNGRVRKPGQRSALAAALITLLLLFIGCSNDLTMTQTTVVPGDGEITFTGTLSATQGGSLSISVSETYATYAWYLDGTALTDATTQTISLDTTGISVGSHTLSVAVTDDDGAASSASVTIAVTL